MSAQPNSTKSMVPIAAQGAAETLFASQVLAASGAWTRSSIVSVAEAREITLLITQTTDATSGTAALT